VWSKGYSLIFIGLWWILSVSVVWGQETSAPVKIDAPVSLTVATRDVPPFVFEEKGKLTGFSIELWQAIADDLHWKYSLKREETIGALLSSVQSGKAQLGIAAISITAERGKTFDFSQPIYDGGLQIMVRVKERSAGAAFLDYLLNFFNPNVLGLLGTMLLLILIAAHIIWLLERGIADEGMIETKRYFPGIFKAFWWAAATLGAQADEMPKSYAARTVAVLWMFTSIFFVAYFTAQLTSDLTVRRLEGAINGPEDLPGKRVATTAGSTAEAYLKNHGVKVTSVEHIEDAYKELENGNVEAVVFDSPVLLYYAAHDGKGKVDTVGQVFKKEAYGIVFPPASRFRRPINESLLHLRENGTYDTIYNKWFSPVDNPQ